jgi:hypothetical protein
MLKNESNRFIADPPPSRASGPEHYQGMLVALMNVRVTEATRNNWGPNQNVTVEDGLGRTFTVQLGWNQDFQTTSAPVDWCNFVGIMDQTSSDLLNNPSAYRLLLMSPGDVTPVPEPGTLALAVLAGLIGLGMWYRRGRNASRAA